MIVIDKVDMSVEITIDQETLDEWLMEEDFNLLQIDPKAWVQIVIEALESFYSPLVSSKYSSVRLVRFVWVFMKIT